jgi:hypothetical protein
VSDETPPIDKVFARMSFTQKLGTVATGIAIIGGSFGVANQAELAEPHWVATRSYVRELLAQANGKLESRQIQTQIYLANSERSRIENELANKKVLLEQNQTMPQGVRDAINEQIRQLLRDLENTKQSLDDLRRDQNGRRP